MSNFTFRTGVRENVGLWINLVGGTGSGKSFSAMRLATGISGDKPFAVIDTENRRALHYADRFKFDHAELRPPFRPDSYSEAVLAADKAGYPVIVVDSGSHVWAGDGGVLDWQEEELERMAGSDYGKRERVKMAAWIKPKMAHKHMVQKLLQVKAHIILCLRAEEKIEMVKVNGRLEVQKKQSMTGKDGWIPVCDKNLPFEATCSFLLMADNPGIPHPIKLQEQHKALFPLDKPITEESGQRLAQWAAGATKQPTDALPVNQKAPEEPVVPAPVVTPSPPMEGQNAYAYISDKDLRDMEITVEQKGIKARFSTKLAANKIPSPDKIPSHLVANFKEWVENAK